MGKGYKRYTDKQRADSVVFLESLGYPYRLGALEEAAKHLKISRTTLQSWFNNIHNPPEELRAESRVELHEAINAELDKIFLQMGAVRDTASYKDLAWAAAVFVDKLQLISGQPTENVKQNISFERTGISTLPQHLTSGATNGTGGEEAI